MKAEADPLVAQQVEFNRGTAMGWDLYRDHRAKVTQLVVSQAMSGPASLCVLGAGNCNDLDLSAADRTFAEIHLVDVDVQAMVGALLRQEVPEAKFRLRELDVSGVGPQLSRWVNVQPGEREIQDVLHALEAGPLVDLGGPFEVVLSAGLLTQIIGTAVAVLGVDHPRLAELALGLRDAHLRLMVSLLVPGGNGVLVTDLVSSDSCPQLLDVPDDQLPALLDRVLSDRNFFTGTNPHSVVRRFGTDPLLARSVAEVAFRGPWRWWVGSRRTYLVYALTFKRRG